MASVSQPMDVILKMLRTDGSMDVDRSVDHEARDVVHFHVRDPLCLRASVRAIIS